MHTVKKLFTKNSLIVSATGLVTLAILFVAWYLLSPVAPSTQQSFVSSPVTVSSSGPSLDGEWIAESNGVLLDASIKSNTIAIDLKDKDTTVTYWKGTFISDAKSGQQVASIKDTTAAIFNASDTKIFTIGDGTISFDMSAMGVTKTMVLSHV